MDEEAPANPGEPKVANQKAGWEMHVILILCLLQAANALKCPRRVSGEPGKAVTIQCHYTPSSINRHQRKYWCRLSTLTWLCHTIVSTNHYTHLRYSGRVAVADFPHSGLFVVRLSQLSPEDAGSYRCGIGNGNNMLFVSVDLTVSAGMGCTSSSTSATPAASELFRRSFETASPEANTWTPGTTQTIERQGTGWGRVALTPGTSKRTASAKGMQTPGIPGVVAAGTGSQVESSVRATIPTPGSLVSAISGMSGTTERAWLWGTRSSAANRARASEAGRETTTEADKPREEAERVRTVLNADWVVIGTSRPSTLASEKWVWETLQEARLISKPHTLDSTEGSAAVWTLEPTSIEMSSAEGSTEGDLDIPVEDSGPRITPSQDLVAGPKGKGSSMKSASPKEKNISWILTSVSTVLFPLVFVALVLLQRKLRRKRTSQETEKAAGVILIQMTHFLELSLPPDQRPHVERKILQDGSPPSHATMTVPERDPGP
ncbi:PREDICTED: high affinity immunoglobulin alpha and immunoglobulin mu Fc receptor [Miniopterus natalensis]|uniref:high affinity immunoglobulin alpha and immunoglobulin mu Fc receptor n=1 Tax=Miniopterus natalensis TaxID=291302 RepID=UPI0007A726F3|nr:PREDICTED: high affinity immunoglobulin alpha and immunoglobulin mu Fc receptor [Miniopterus natalensis]